MLLESRAVPTPDPRRLFVFSHPNHELAVLGLVRRWRPHLVFLTDGGGPERVAETRRSLRALDLLSRATFLDHGEGAFYGALLARDADFFRRVADEVAARVRAVQPGEVYCDAVEFYNPVHDICRPIVRAALREAPDAELFEIPLVHQAPGHGERYVVQRAPARAARGAREVRLTDEELLVKCRARDEIYGCLREQMGSVLAAVPPEHLVREQVVPAGSGWPEPGPERVLRYEWRGARLRERGEIEDVITYAGHYAPVAAALLP